MPFESSGSLTTDVQSVSDVYAWASQSEWAAFQSRSNIQIENGVVKLAEMSVIPDSEADSKLIHRWYLSENSSPFVDQIGTADSTSVTGTAQVTGSQYVDDAARDGDGADDNIDTTTWGSFGANRDSDFAVALTLDTTDNDVALLGQVDGGEVNPNYFHISIGEPENGAVTGGVPNGQPVLGMRDGGSGDLLIAYADSVINDGSLTRLVVNKTANSGSGAVEFWFDGTEQSVTLSSDENPTSFNNFGRSVMFFALNDTGTAKAHANTILDDICVFDSSLTNSEIQSYTKP